MNRPRSPGVRPSSNPDLVEPRSVTTQSSGAAARARRASVASSGTGAAITTARAPSAPSSREPQATSMAPIASAVRNASGSGSTPRTSTPSRERRARPSEPPISPTPTMATGPMVRSSGDGHGGVGALGHDLPHQVDAPPVSYTHLRAHETDSYLVCRLLLE